MDILLVDTNNKDARSIVEVVKNKAWEVDQCTNGLHALNKIRYSAYDLVITEIYIPVIDGMSLCTLIKEQQPRLKVVIATKETCYQKRIQAFHAGADEYILKPITAKTFEEKIEKLVQKTSPEKELRRLKIRDLVMNLETREVHRFGERIPLKKLEFNMLMFMMVNHTRPLNRHTILEHVWEGDIGSAATNIIDVYINRLRKKIDQGRREKLIHTVHGVGYKLA